jgi:hypothetical protein
MATASSLGVFLVAVRDALSARPGLAGVRIFTGPVGEKDIGQENIVFAVESIDVAQDFPTAGQREAFESYPVEGRIWIVKPGSGENAIEAARERALEILGEVQSECSANMTMDGSVRSLLLTSYSLTQLPLDAARDCRVSFTIEVKANFTAP